MDKVAAEMPVTLGAIRRVVPIDALAMLIIGYFRGDELNVIEVAAAAYGCYELVMKIPTFHAAHMREACRYGHRGIVELIAWQKKREDAALPWWDLMGHMRKKSRDANCVAIDEYGTRTASYIATIWDHGLCAAAYGGWSELVELMIECGATRLQSAVLYAWLGRPVKTSKNGYYPPDEKHVRSADYDRVIASFTVRNIGMTGRQTVRLFELQWVKHNSAVSDGRAIAPAIDDGCSQAAKAESREAGWSPETLWDLV